MQISFTGSETAKSFSDDSWRGERKEGRKGGREERERKYERERERQKYCLYDYL
jgi:hypothetical protein